LRRHLIMTTLSFPIPAPVDSPATPRVLRLAIVLALVQALWMFAAVNFVAPHYSDLLTGDIAYFLGAAKHALAGEMPYRDFAFEYPPGALLAMLAPAALVGRSPDATSYLWALVFQNAVLAGVITLLLSRWSGLRAAAAFNLLLAIGAAFVPLRFDLLPALLTLLAVRYAIDRPVRSGAFLAIGVCVKLYPAVLLPMLLVPHLTARRWRDGFQLALGFAATMALVLIPFAVLSHNHLFDFLAFHRARGLQIESVAGAAILLASKLHLTSATVGTSFFSSNVTSPWSSGAMIAMQLAMLALLGMQLLQEWMRWHSGKSHDLAIVATTTLLIFIACNKVFSPQYVVWVFPLVAMTRSRFAVAAAICLLTSTVFPFLYDSLKQIDWLPVLLVNARNVLLLAMIIYGFTTRPRNKIVPV